MDLKEAIKQLESLKRDRESFLIQEQEHDEIFLKDIQAIDVATEELKKLEAIRMH